VGVEVGSEVELGAGVRVARARLGVRVAVWVDVREGCGVEDGVWSGARSVAALAPADWVGESVAVADCALGPLVGGLSQQGRIVLASRTAATTQAAALVGVPRRIKVCTSRGVRTRPRVLALGVAIRLPARILPYSKR